MLVENKTLKIYNKIDFWKLLMLLNIDFIMQYAQ